jgi:HSP20 family protein
MLTVRRRPMGVPAFVNVFEDFFNHNFPEKTFGEKGSFIPAVNVTEDEKEFKLEIAVPGFEKTDFDVQVEKDFFTVSGKKEAKTEVKEKNYTRKEFSYSNFKRTFTLPENVETANISAVYENGILHVALPKKEVKADVAVKKIDIK